jgi:hypothetical protein
VLPNDRPANAGEACEAVTFGMRARDSCNQIYIWLAHLIFVTTSSEVVFRIILTISQK